MSRQEQHYYATPAPRVEEAVVEKIMDNSIEPAIASPAGFALPATVDPAPAVEPATLYTKPTTDPQQQRQQQVKGLSTKTIRGSTGADFESSAGVIVGRVRKNVLQLCLPCLYDERDFVSFGEVKKYVLVKDGLAYVYVAESDPSPLFAIELQDYTAVQEDPRNPDKGSTTVNPMPNTNLPPPTMKTILLKNKSNGQLEFQFTFDESKQQDTRLAQTFLDLVEHHVSSRKKKHDGSLTTTNSNDTMPSKTGKKRM